MFSDHKLLPCKDAQELETIVSLCYLLRCNSSHDGISECILCLAALVNWKTAGPDLKDEIINISQVFFVSASVKFEKDM